MNLNEAKKAISKSNEEREKAEKAIAEYFVGEYKKLCQKCGIQFDIFMPQSPVFRLIPYQEEKNGA